MKNTKPDQLNEYHELVHYGLMVGEAPGFSEVREELCHLVLVPPQLHELIELDTFAMYAILHDEDIQDYVLRDDPTRPLTHWWWHLGKLHAGTYPAELLPKHLRTIYLETTPAVA